MLPSSRRAGPSRPGVVVGRSASTDWKFGFVGSERDDGASTSRRRRSTDDARPMADAEGTVATFTVDRLAYSQSPPVVFAVVDFDGGGRLPVELTDVDADDVAIGDAGGDDLPPAVHRRRHPQLLLEGPAGRAAV